LEWEEVAVVLGGYEAAEAVRFVRGLCEAFRVEDVSIRTMPVGGLHPGRSAGVFAGEICIGVVGEIHPDVMEAYGSVERAAYFSCVLGGPEPWHGGEGLLSVERAPEAYQPFSRMPSSDVDFAFVVSDAVAPEALAATIRSASPLVRSADLFDVYRGAGVEQGSRSLAYRVRLQDADRTLTEAEISTAREAVLAAAATTHAATLR
jgi:phenylalanyl-tRNA synthetase beta chain